MRSKIHFMFLALFVFSVSSLELSAQDGPGLIEGAFKPCPNSPNCVSSMETRKRKSIYPISYECGFEEAKEIVRDLIESQGGELVVQERLYLHYAVSTSVGKFVDDVEIVFDEMNLIQIKSASRVGYGDFGANRRRLKRLTKAFKDAERELLGIKSAD